MLLAIDTSAGTSVAVVDGGGVLAEVGSAETMRHAEVVGDAIAEALAVSGIPIAAFSGVAAGMGPGPFTGLRVGIAAARAFAFGAGKPVLPLASHDALAFERYRAGHAGPLLVVTDARRREVYWSLYGGVDEFGIPLRSGGPGLGRPDELPHRDVRRFDAAACSAGSLGVLAELTRRHQRAFAKDEALYLRSPDVTPSNGPKRVTG